MASSTINYPKALGWSSVAASAIFAALYSPLVAYFVFQIVRARRLVVFTMTVFCLIRMAAFIMRAIALGVESAGENLGLFIATEVLFQAGFFGLLYSTYTLVLDRIELYEAYSLSIPIFGRTLGLLKNRRLFRFALMVPVALGIAAVDIASTDPTNTTASALRKTSAILFLILTAFQVVLSLVLISAERQGKDILPYNSSSFGARHVSFIIGLIAVLLLIREIFSVATIPDFARANNEHYWYPLVALPELLCAALYTVPGVIPPKIRQTATELDSCLYPAYSHCNDHRLYPSFALEFYDLRSPFCRRIPFGHVTRVLTSSPMVSESDLLLNSCESKSVLYKQDSESMIPQIEKKTGTR